MRIQVKAALTIVLVAAVPLKVHSQSCATAPAPFVWESGSGLGGSHCTLNNPPVTGTAMDVCAAEVCLSNSHTSGASNLTYSIKDCSVPLPTAAGIQAPISFHVTPTPTGVANGIAPSVKVDALYSIGNTACPAYSVTSVPAPNTSTCSANCLGHPINPAIGNVYTSETDVQFAGFGPIAFRRFYNSADATGVDGVAGWRHSYDRNIQTVYQFPSSPYLGRSSAVSPQYSTPQMACTQGFPTIQASVSAWAGATASYDNGVCVVSKGSSTIATLPIQNYPLAQPSSSPIEYDVVRDDGQILRYPVLSGVITNPPGVSIRLAVTGSGFTVTDDDDNVEIYNTAGVLQSITSRAGVVQTIHYDDDGLFYEVIDSFGNSLTVTRNDQGSIDSIAPSGGGTVEYAYFGAWLSTVTNLDSTTRSYVYGDLRFINALTATIDESGTTFSSWRYDASERATSTAAAISGSRCPTCQEPAATSYDAAGYVSSRTEYNGNVTCYANDPVRGLELVRVEGFAPGSTCPTSLSTYTPASGTLQRKITTAWSSTWREPSFITEQNRTTAFTFDGSGNIRTKTITDTGVSPNVVRTWAYTYTGFGQVLTAIGPDTDVLDKTTYTYYSCTTGAQCGQVHTITDAVGQVTTFNAYNSYGQPLTITDPKNVVTTLTYDAGARVTSSKAGTQTTQYSYWPIGLLKLVTLPDGRTIQFTYDGAHRLTTVTDSRGNHIQYPEAKGVSQRPAMILLAVAIGAAGAVAVGLYFRTARKAETG